jgi:hypothetical protein
LLRQLLLLLLNWRLILRLWLQLLAVLRWRLLWLWLWLLLLCRRLVLRWRL